MIISIDAEKAFDNSTTIYDKKKKSPESRNKRNIPYHNKNHKWQSHSKHYPQWQKIENISSDLVNHLSSSSLMLPSAYSSP